eukprot:scaffold7757_cov107-Isochrysis_galbana.AAC.2
MLRVVLLLPCWLVSHPHFSGDCELPPATSSPAPYHCCRCLLRLIYWRLATATATLLTALYCYSVRRGVQLLSGRRCTLRTRAPTLNPRSYPYPYCITGVCLANAWPVALPHTHSADSLVVELGAAAAGHACRCQGYAYTSGYSVHPSHCSDPQPRGDEFEKKSRACLSRRTWAVDGPASLAAWPADPVSPPRPALPVPSTGAALPPRQSPRPPPAPPAASPVPSRGWAPASPA